MSFYLFGFVSFAKEFNYDKREKHRFEFGWLTKGCDKLFVEMSDKFQSALKYDVSARFVREWSCENSSEMSETPAKAVGDMSPVIRMLMKYRADCVCDAYVALRLTAEGYSSAKAGGGILEFDKTTKMFEMARQLSAHYDKQLQKFKKELDKLEIKGREFCADFTTTACDTGMKQRYCDYPNSKLALADIPEESMFETFGMLVDNPFKYWRHTSSAVTNLKLKTERGFASMSDNKTPTPYCQNNWGQPNTREPDSIKYFHREEGINIQYKWEKKK